MQISAFSTNAQSRFASVVVDGVLGPLRLARHTLRCPCISVVPEATHEASRGPEKGAMSDYFGMFKLIQCHTRALVDSLRALFPELQRYKDTVRCGPLDVEVPGHRQQQLTQTSIVRL